jgi:hypothetical protein
MWSANYRLRFVVSLSIYLPGNIPHALRAQRCEFAGPCRDRHAVCPSFVPVTENRYRCKRTTRTHHPVPSMQICPQRFWSTGTLAMQSSTAQSSSGEVTTQTLHMEGKVVVRSADLCSVTPRTSETRRTVQLLGLLLETEDGGNVLLWSVRLSPNYATVQARGPNGENLVLFPFLYKTRGTLSRDGAVQPASPNSFSCVHTPILKR